ncbi:hypothetical protein AK812_SmicGene18183 [Symbiodinium microadriaticum]|uniref:Uncharacterized protein n=1 Tax=Symbiodinium microadriaticum TaxID=2951 RepID=A0A1Q9DVS8_SYMMI|nr:hypothetical protein AK812_SmicGene18183 [Symbiodinium microadriaticum]
MGLDVEEHLRLAEGRRGVFLEVQGSVRRGLLDFLKLPSHWNVMAEGVLGHQVDTGKKPFGEKLAPSSTRALLFTLRHALHYSEALQYAIEGPFKKFPAIAALARFKKLFVLVSRLVASKEEDVIVSADFLLFFQQLREVLEADDSLLCARSSLVPVHRSAHGTKLLEGLTLPEGVDSFPGTAWMFASQRLMRWGLRLLSHGYPEGKSAGRQGRCIVPEVARARRIGEGHVDGRVSAKTYTQQSAEVFVSPRPETQDGA